MRGIMKKTLVSLAVCIVMVLALTLVPGTVTTAHAASGDVAINSTNFPAKKFRIYVQENFDKNGDNVLSTAEIAAVKEINVSSMDLTTIKGVAFFTALEKLECGYNELTKLDVSKNTMLEELSCPYNKLTALDLSKNTKLKVLHCDLNDITALDVSKNTALEELSCMLTGLTSLDVSNNTKLKELNCLGAELTSLNVSGATAMTKLSCSYNQLTSLDVSANTALVEMDCAVNQLTALNVTKNTALTELTCSFNHLKKLDVTKNTALVTLSCGENELTALDVTRNTALVELEFAGNKLTEIDLSKNTALTSLSCYGNPMAAVDVSACPLLAEACVNGGRGSAKNSGTINDYSFDYEYYMYVNSNDGSYVYADKTDFIIAAHPKNRTVVDGKTAKFTVKAVGDDLKYQWQVKTPGGSWKNSGSTGSKTATLSVTATEARNGYQYRCVVSNQGGSFATKAAKLTVKMSAPEIITQPKAQTVAAGKTVTFSVKAAGGGLTYQWWYKAPGGEWTKVKVNGTSATYTLTAQERHNGYRYRCRVYNTEGVAASDIVKLTVVTAPAITTQPANKTVNAGEKATFKVVATGGGLSYQWWYLKPGTTEWTKVSKNGTSATYSLTAEARHNGYQYKCIITNAAGTVTSKTVKLTVK